jgi:hypothetical protein
MADDRVSLTEALRDWEQRSHKQLAAGVGLVQRWAEAFPASSLPFRLVRLHGESNTLLRWRRCVRKPHQARHGSRFELINDIPAFTALPVSVRSVILDFERRRIQINYEYATAAYRVQRLKALAAQHAALADLRRLHRAALEPETPSSAR